MKKISIPITNVISTEEALRQSEQRLRLLYHLTMEGIVIHDNGIIMESNDALAKMFGYGSASEMVGVSGLDLMTPETQRLFIEHMKTDSEEPYEGTGIKKDGTLFPIEIYARNIVHEGQRVRAGTVYDLTERKRAEEMLRESEQKFIKVFQGNAAAIALTRLRDGRLIDVNEKWLELFGLSRDEIVGKTTVDKIKLWKYPEERKKAINDLEKHGSFRNRECTFLRKNGEEWIALLSSEIIQLQEEKVILSSSIDITESKRAEKALRDSEEQFRRAIEEAPIPVIMHAEDGEVLQISRTWTELTGYMLQDVPTLDAWLNKAYGEGAEKVRDHMHELFKGSQRSIDIEFPIHTRHGQIRHWSFSASSPGKLLDGRRFIVGMAVDITEGKRAEEALRESEERFRVAQEVSPDGFSILRPMRDEHGRVVDFTWVYENATAARFTGVEPEKLLGRRLLELFPGHRETEFLKAYQEVAETGERRVFEAHYGKETVAPRWFRTVVVPTGGDIAVLVQDIAEQKQAEEALQKAHDELELRVQERTEELEEANVELEAKIEEHQRAEDKIREQAELLDKAQDAIGLRDLNHRLIYWNKGAERLYGWTTQEIIGKSADKLLYKEESPSLVEAKKRVIVEGEWKGELSQITKEGKEIIVESRWTLMRDDTGTPKSILIINTDITEKKKVEAQLLRAQRMESIGTLAGGIAHDLNNMLTPIMISLQLLKGKFKDEQSQKLLTILDNNTKRGADLIKQVLSFSRGVEGERVPLQVKYIITEIEKIIKETFPRNIEIGTDTQKALPTISGDATQLHQVIMNLCVNARDAMPDGGILKIEAKNFFINENYVRLHPEAKVGSYVVISVSDTGTGIPPEIIDRIFEPFFTTKELGKGTGLGLSTALGIVKSHGGFIDVQSEGGKGSTFRVYLPAVKTEPQNVKEEKLESPIGHGELVLVAEDEESIREVTASTLESSGYKVLTANNGAEAVALYTRNKDKIKVVLMDMMMPVMDGETSIRAIRKINPWAKVIVVSGLAEKDKLAKIEKTRAQAILPKPYTAERLLKSINEVLSAK